jgi:hypothetical protein
MTRILLPLLLLALTLPVWGQTSKSASPSVQDREQPSEASAILPHPCQDEAPRLIGQKSILIGKEMRSPRKLHDAKVKWPAGSESRSVGGVWVGEALIGPDGATHHVWVLREFIASPPWPKANEAIIAAIKEWTWTPTKVKGKAVPVCMTVVVNAILR